MHSVSVELSGIQLRRGDRLLFSKPVAMACAAGALNILSGQNGSGKTSVLDIIADRTPKPAEASIRRTGHTKAEEIAYLPQQLWDILDIRIDDLLALAFGKRTLPRICPAEVAAAVAKRKKELGALSGGQRQLLLFWLVCSQPRNVYVYDEPFRHLDDVASDCVSQAIETQVGQGKLVILSEHSPKASWTVACNRLTLEKSSTAVL